MYGIYANIVGILMGSMLPYIAAPWILWAVEYFTMSMGIQQDPNSRYVNVPYVWPYFVGTFPEI